MTTDETTRVLTAVLSLAEDVGALSDELHFAGWDDAERTELDHGRANILRALTLPAGALVLQVGADFGGLTRYLGEEAPLVHAVEPDHLRGEAVRLRTRGLDSVRVFPGQALPLPPGPAYDLVLVAQPFATPALLEAVRERLAPSGAVVVFSSSRSVAATMAAAGLPVRRELTCTPGHEVARAVVTQELAADFPRLASAIADGTGHDLLLLAGEGASALWPGERLATYFNTAERAAFACTRADVVRTPTGAEVRRRPLVASAPIGGISIEPCTDVVYDAPTMADVLYAEPWRAPELLTAWRDLVRAEAARGGLALWDLVPHNVLVDREQLRPIDLEWRHAGAGAPEVIERGVLVLADLLAGRGWSGAATGSTVRELAGWLGVLIGLAPTFVDNAVKRETDFSTIASCGTESGTAEVREAIGKIWAERLERAAGSAEATPAGKPPEYRSTLDAANKDEVVTP